MKKEENEGNGVKKLKEKNRRNKWVNEEKNRRKIRGKNCSKMRKIKKNILDRRKIGKQLKQKMDKNILEKWAKMKKKEKI